MYEKHAGSLKKAVDAVNDSKLAKTIDTAKTLLESSNGNVQDDKTCEELSKAIEAKDEAAIAKASKAVNDSIAAKQKADEEAIRVFAENLRQLLLAAPLGEKSVLGIDPGQRTGCKIVCLDRQGALLHHDVIYPHPPQNETARSVSKILSLIDKFSIEAVAIGNGTASRETEQFVRSYLPSDSGIKVYVVSEAGASVYSASKTARDEFRTFPRTLLG